MTTVHRVFAFSHSAGLSLLFGHITRRIRDMCHARIVGGVSSQSEPLDSRDSASLGAASPGSASLARGITATWWSTAGAVVFFEMVLVLVWVGTVAAAGLGRTAALTIAIGGLVWAASTVALLADYRHRADAAPGVRWLRLLAPMLIALVFGVVGGVLTGSWLMALFPIAQSLILLNWQRGVRLRVALAITAVMACMLVIDARVVFAPGGALDGLIGSDSEWGVTGFYSVLLPIVSLTSLWWWDVLNALDRARASEARLAATQERLRVATDVHDLQGHHLQVVALQLELAERLASRDPAASLEQLQAARRSVGEAQQGTRDLALRFRSVPLGDEIANAADLLHAAGLDVETSVDVNAEYAPASDLGPVIRETTTNVLRHGGGKHARLELARIRESWRYEISNDRVAGVEDDRDGSGLEGIARRIGEAGGTLEVRRGDEEFTVIVTVPAGRESVRAQGGAR